MLDGDVTALTIFQKIGLYLGYTVPWYREFYGFDSMMILGRVTSGPGGVMILETCLLYTSDAADDLLCVDLGGRRIIKKKKITNTKTKQICILHLHHAALCMLKVWSYVVHVHP